MKKWELAKYLIDAKKCIDSLSYIYSNINCLKHISIQDKVNTKLREFYINCCAILDNSYPRKKKELCASDSIVERLYYERDKNFAHKDSYYKPKEYASPKDMIFDLKETLLHLKELCKETLPSAITLDFVSFDRELFRMVEGLTAEEEDLINSEKYPYKDKLALDGEARNYKVLNDIEDLKSNVGTHNYVPVVGNGINTYEGLQNRQDFCIKTNFLY